MDETIRAVWRADEIDGLKPNLIGRDGYVSETHLWLVLFRLANPPIQLEDGRLAIEPLSQMGPESMTMGGRKLHPSHTFHAGSLH